MLLRLSLTLRQAQGEISPLVVSLSNHERVASGRAINTGWVAALVEPEQARGAAAQHARAQLARRHHALDELPRQERIALRAGGRAGPG
jgi:hypothetical protein